MQMKVCPEYFVDDEGQRHAEGFSVVELDEEGSITGYATGTMHPTRDAAKTEIRELLAAHPADKQ